MAPPTVSSYAYTALAMLLYWFLVALMVITHAGSQSYNETVDGVPCIFDNVDECQYYYDLLESALLKDSNNIYKLRLAFFPTDGDSRVVNEVQVDLELSTTADLYDIGCNDFNDNPTFYRGQVWSDSYTWRSGSSLAVHVTGIAASVLFTATLYEGIIVLAYSYFPYYMYVAVYQQDTSGGYVYLKLDLGTTLSCNPDRWSTEYVALLLVSWVSTQRSGERGHASKLDCSN